MIGHTLRSQLKSSLFPVGMVRAIRSTKRDWPRIKIEHITYKSGLFMLRECYRVLKAGGRFRIATPNLGNLLGLLTTNNDDLKRRYIKWAVDMDVPEADAYRASFVINNFFGGFDHLFVYDPATLQSAMEAANFRQITRHSPGETNDDNLRRIESHGERISEEMNRFEAMVLEAIRPA